MLRIGGKEEKIANFPLPNPPLGLHRSPIFSYLTPFFLPSSFIAEPGPRLFPVVLCFCRCLWQDLISDSVIVETVFLWPLWSLKLFSTAKEPFVTKIFFSPSSKSVHLKSYIRVVVRECDDFLVPCYVWRQVLKPNKIRNLHDVVIYE